MKIPGYLIIGLLALILVAAAGCTAPQTAAVQTPATAPQASLQTATTAAIRTAPAAGIDTTINVRFNELACISVQEHLGSTYLYPDQKFQLEAAPPEPHEIDVNVLFIDENDQLKLRQAKPKWDEVKKTWVYDGPVPLAKFIDITAPIKTTFTIKTQSKYYICADDRKESGTKDVVYRVPIKLTRL